MGQGITDVQPDDNCQILTVQRRLTPWTPRQGPSRTRDLYRNRACLRTVIKNLETADLLRAGVADPSYSAIPHQK